MSTRSVPFLIGSLLIQGYRIYPYTFFVPKVSLPTQSDDPERLISILSANVLMDNGNFDTLMECIEKWDPDVLLLTETNARWERALDPIETRYPFTIKKPLDNTYGILMYSRYELLGPNIKFLVEDDVPSIYSAIRMPSGESVDFYGLHPRPPRLNQDVHERDAELLIVGHTIERRQRPAIVAGDLNDVAWSHTTRLFRRLSGLLDPRIGRGFFNTFPTHLPFFRFPMDHIFHSTHFRLKSLEVLKSFGSDHYPIFAILSFEENRLHSFNAEKDVRLEAQEKIKEGLRQTQIESAH